MKKILFLLLMLFVISNAAPQASFAAASYADLYQKAQPADFELVHGIDPYQNEDYQRYAYAPYPLFRLSSDVYFKSKAIPAGYYTLVPRNMNGKDYVFFKEGLIVKFMIPAVKTEIVPIDFYHNNLPVPKLTKWQGFCKKTSEGFYKLFKNSSKKEPPPKSYIVTDNVEGNYYLIKIYYGQSLYYLVFRNEKY